MKVFISWSKPVSLALGLVLRDWLPEVIQSMEPWVSSEDIDKGQRWRAEVGTKLGELGQGVLCVTPENQREPWLNFEAGALAKSLDNARVRPVLLGLQPSEVTGPLAQFQATVASDHDDMFRLIASLNAACAAPLDGTRLERAFERNWPDYVKRLASLPSAAPLDELPQRSQDDMIGEILERVREVQRSIDSQRPDDLRWFIPPSEGTGFALGAAVVLPNGDLGRVTAIQNTRGRKMLVRVATLTEEGAWPITDLRLATKVDIQKELRTVDLDLGEEGN
ncbi:hypothetical protein TPA0907_61780 [Micromonospora humidisoli]|uniref:hypothetical protein n=1 Tax=Micromonospora sp. AKA109 TaxID=2733865 RepID=UPI0022BE84CA|nr:hypothetical protein [Micromonospora sp. AKA109]GHJ11811.1 hypothetical protein TPA0907_61780 [Micromonospora sp. AKA109]